MQWRPIATLTAGLRTIVEDRYLLAIVVIGSFFRIFDLSSKNIWLDEAYSLKFAQLSPRQIYFLDQDSPPLYYFVLHYWLPIAGQSEIALRFPSVLFGIAALIVIYALGKKLFGTHVGRLCALLLAVSVFQIRYAQEARTYTLMVLLTLLSMYFFVDLVKKFSIRTSAAYVVFTVLLIYSHVYALFIVAAQNVYFAVVCYSSGRATGSDIRAWITAQILVVGAYAPWAFVLAQVTMKVQQGFWVPETELRDVYSSFITYSSGSRLLLLGLLVSAAYSLVAIEKAHGTMTARTIIASLGDYRWTLRLPNVETSFLLLLWLLAPIILPFLVSQFFQPIYVTRYTIGASLAFIIMAARGIGNVGNLKIRSLVIVAVVVLSMVQLANYYATSQKEQWRDVARHIDTLGRPGDLALFNATDAMLPFNYYSRSKVLSKDGVSDINEGNIGARWSPVNEAERVWVVLAHPGKNRELISKRLLESFQLSSNTVYYDIDVQLFERKYR